MWKDKGRQRSVSQGSHLPVQEVQFLCILLKWKLPTIWARHLLLAFHFSLSRTERLGHADSDRPFLPPDFSEIPRISEYSWAGSKQSLCWPMAPTTRSTKALRAGVKHQDVMVCSPWRITAVNLCRALGDARRAAPPALGTMCCPRAFGSANEEMHTHHTESKARNPQQRLVF